MLFHETRGASALVDMIDTQRSLRLEAIIVVLILFEIVMTVYELLTRTSTSLAFIHKIPAGTAALRRYFVKSIKAPVLPARKTNSFALVTTLSPRH
jgi:hypothetical protein